MGWWPFGKKEEPAAPAAAAPATYRMGLAADLGAGPVPVFPILMGPAWQRAPTQVCRPLITGVKLPDIPSVAMVYLMPPDGSTAPGRGYIRQERVEQLGKTTADFEAEALFNLSLRRATWTEMSPGPGITIASCTDDYLAAERILDPAFVRLAAQRLGETSLVVGIPARGQLHATRLSVFTSGKTNGQAMAFKMLMEQTFRQAGDPGITPWIFIVLDGRINSVLELG